MLDETRALLDAGAPVDAAAIDGWTPLFSAAMHGHAPVVALLLERGAQADRVIETKEPLFYACASGDTATLVAFTSRGTRAPNAEEAAQLFVSAHVRAGHRAVQTIAADIYEELGEMIGEDEYDYVRIIETREQWAIDGPLELPDDVIAPIRAHIARSPNLVQIGNIDFVRGAGAGLSDASHALTRWRGRLYTAALAAHLQGQQVLGTDELQRLLGIAAPRGDERVVDVLLREVAPTHDALFSAILGNHAAIVGRLVVDVHAENARGESAIRYAANTRAAGAVSVLLDKGAPVDDADPDGWTPLFHAVTHNGPAALDTVLTLLERGANANARRKGGKTPLMSAASVGDAPIVARLIEARAEIDAQDERGRTALHEVCAQTSGTPQALAVIELLLGAGADLEVRDALGRTPLHDAAVHAPDARLAVLELLVAHGADLDAKDAEGRTPQDLAHAGGRMKAEAMLVAAAERRRSRE